MGINMGHDRSVAVVKDGEIVVAIEQERLDRIKHSVGFMLQAPDALGQIQVPESIAYCLDYLNVPLVEMASITANMPGIDAEILRGQIFQGCCVPSQDRSWSSLGPCLLSILAIRI